MIHQMTGGHHAECFQSNPRPSPAHRSRCPSWARTRTGYLVCTALAVLVLAAACGGGASKEEEAKAEEWAWLTETQNTLTSKRQELADLMVQAEAAAAMEAEAGEERAAVHDVRLLKPINSRMWEAF